MHCMINNAPSNRGQQKQTEENHQQVPGEESCTGIEILTLVLLFRTLFQRVRRLPKHGLPQVVLDEAQHPNHLGIE